MTAFDNLNGDQFSGTFDPQTADWAGTEAHFGQETEAGIKYKSPTAADIHGRKAIDRSLTGQSDRQFKGYQLGDRMARGASVLNPFVPARHAERNFN
jgi:hypothetical protein